MADPQPPAGGKTQGGKILGMPRTTGLVVLGIGALVVGYFVISHFSGKKSSQSGGGQGSGGGGHWHGSGHASQVRVIREWQGHGGGGRRK